MGGTKYATSTATKTLPTYLQDAYTKIVGSAQNTASQPYTPYTGGFTPDQQAAFGNIRSLWGASDPSFSGASTALGTSMVPTYNTVGAYMNPFIQNVVDATQANIQESNARQQQDVIGNAIAKGAFGGNRVGVAQAELARQQNLANQKTIADLYSQGYSGALGAAQADKAAALEAAGRYAGLGQTQMQTALAQAGAQLGAGTQQQQFDYQQYLNQLAFPYQQQSWLASIMGGLAPSAGGTTTESKPDGNLFSQILGTGLQLLPMFLSDERAKEDVAAVGKTFDGQTIYRYRYKGDPRMQIGLVAQEVPNPEAVGQRSDGMLGVDYEKATDKAAKRGHFAGGGLVGAFPYSNNDNNAFPSYMAAAGVAPYSSANDNGFPSYIPKVAMSGVGGESFPEISRNVPKDDILSRIPDAATLRSTGDSIRASFSTPKLHLGYNLANGGVVGRNGYAKGGIPSFDALWPGEIDPRKNIVPDALIPRIEATTAEDLPLREPMVAQPAPAGVVPNKVPRGLRNNNPGNLVVSDWTMGRPGYSGSDGRFAIFDTPEAGRAAMVDLLSNYGRRGFDTVGEIINRWAPPSDNNPTGDYISYVARRAGVDPNAELNAEQLALVADAISEFENGTQQGGGVAAAGNPGGVAGPNLVPFTGGGQFTTTPAPGYSQSVGDVVRSLREGNGLNLSPDMRQALLAAGMGMMASKSPFALAGIGEGGLVGIETWNARQALERENALARGSLGATGAAIGQTEATTGQIAQQTQIDRWERRYTPAGVIIIDKTSGSDPGKLYKWGEVLPDGSIANPVTAQTERPGLFSTEAPAGLEMDPLLMTPETMQIPLTQVQQAQEAARSDAITSQQTQQMLQDMKHSLAQLPEEGWASPGTDFPGRINLMKGINTYAQVAGLNPIFSEGEIAAGENLNKLTTRLGFDLSRILGSGEAASVIESGIAAVPGGANSKEGAQMIIASLEAANRRRIDYYNFLQNWAGKYASMAGADEYFNMVNPPELYAMSAFVPREAMEFLRANPDQRAAFNEKYGKGDDLARFVLGQ